jgi:hypothetical protein
MIGQAMDAGAEGKRTAGAIGRERCPPVIADQQVEAVIATAVGQQRRARAQR